MTELPRIDGLQASTATAPPPEARAAERTPRFQELLERLQRLAAEQPKPDDVDGPEGLQQALRSADDGFVAAMDLRKQLEEAFRRHLR